MKCSFPLFLTAFLLVSTSLFGDNLRFASRPSLSPDGKTIYFSYDGDLFTVASTGGQAMSFLSMKGNQNHPVPSPDGKYLAFSSDINGNQDVYVIPMAGGAARQLTFHEAADFPVSWSADSKYIFFESRRASATRTTFRVAVEGGTPQELFDGYFTTIVNLVENPATGEFFFNESAESINFPTRKRYVGDHNPNIISWNPRSRKYTELTDYIGKDAWPMVDAKGNLYYVSDEANKESNIVRYVKGGKPVQLTSFDRSVQYPKISKDGSAIVYLLDYQIHVFDTKTGKDAVPQITLSSGDNDVRRSFEKQKPTSADVSPDGKKFAFAIRGLLYVSDTKCKYFQRLATPSDERVHEVCWSGDSKTIYYTRTEKGYTGLYSIPADNSGAEKTVYAPARNVKSLTLSHKGDKIAFVDGQRNLMICNIADNVVEKVAEAEFWSFWNYSLAFSFDDSVLAFEAMKRFEPDIFICDLKEKKVVNLTNSASTETEMVFSPDGKNMFITAVITASAFPRGFNCALYKLPLRKYDSKFKSENYDSLFSKEKTKKDSTVVIDYDNVFDRLQRLERRGTQNGLFVFESKGKALLFYNSNGDAGREVRALDINDPEARPKPVKGLMPGAFFASKTDLYHISSGTVSRVEPNSLTATPIEASVNVDKVLSDEFRQMFYEVWAVLDQNFYDVNLHGTDWQAVREYYSSLLPYVKNRDQLRTLIADMLGELNSSHLGFNSMGSEEKKETAIRSLITGITFDRESPYKVADIVPWSPADKVEVDIRKGDVLVAVDGVKVDPKENREKYFSSPVAKDEVRLTFSRGGKEKDVKVHTTSFNEYKSLMYRQWEDECKAKVEKEGKGRIAYLHMRAMGVGDLDNFYREMHTYAVNRDALILDLRYNNGGNVHKEVIDFLRQKQHYRWSYRDFPTTSHPNVTPADKPVVVLVNEHSLSDAEVTSNGIKTLGIAKLVGTETYRWIIYTSSVGLIDGSSCRMPAWGCYNNEGLDLENIGVKPDIYVKTTFKDRISHEDPQLDAAIKEVLSQLGK